MTPRLPVNHLRYAHLRHAEVGRNVASLLASLRAGADIAHDLIGKHGGMASRAYVRGAATLHHISGIVGSGAQSEVLRVDAGRVIASVQHEERINQRPVMDGIGDAVDSVSLSSLSANHDGAISEVIDGAGVDQALTALFRFWLDQFLPRILCIANRMAMASHESLGLILHPPVLAVSLIGDGSATAASAFAKHTHILPRTWLNSRQVNRLRKGKW
jgi:hypothetical protein